MDLHQENQKLHEEINRLKTKILDLENKVKFFETYNRMANGIRGETLIASLVDGEINSIHKGGYDLETKNKIKIEVKFSLIRDKQRTNRHWQWNNVLGHNNNKKYDYIILMADSHEKYRDTYRDRNSPYIFFVLSWDQINDLTSHLGNGKSKGGKTVTLSTNVANAKPRKGSYAHILFGEYQRTADEIHNMFLFD